MLLQGSMCSVVMVCGTVQSHMYTYEAMQVTFHDEM